MAANPIKLDIACGADKQAGFVGIDIAPIPGVDFVHDLETFPWPLEDESVIEAVCLHYVEHTKNLIAFVEELYRVMRKGALCTVRAPYYTSIRAWQDPTHTRAITENTFLYFNAQWRQANGLAHYPIRSDFDCAISFLVDPVWGNVSEKERTFAMRHYFNVIHDIQVRLTKR